jgi:hypothetical protein
MEIVVQRYHYKDNTKFSNVSLWHVTNLVTCHNDTLLMEIFLKKFKKKLKFIW